MRRPVDLEAPVRDDAPERAGDRVAAVEQRDAERQVVPRVELRQVRHHRRVEVRFEQPDQQPHHDKLRLRLDERVRHRQRAPAHADDP